MSPTQTAVNVARRQAELEQMLDRQRQGLGRLCAEGNTRAWQALDAIYREPRVQFGSSPRLKAVV